MPDMETNKRKHQLTLDRVQLGELAPLSQPLVLYVEASSYCNLACNFCPHYLSPERLHKQNMSFDLFKKVIDDINLFDSPIKMLRMCGTGDSLMNKNLGKMIEYAKTNKNFEKFELITNGLLLNDKIAEQLTSCLTRLIISVEGLCDEDYVKFANRKINFNDYVKKIKKLYSVRNECSIHIKIHNNAVPTPAQKEIFFSTFGNYCDEIYIENLVDLWPDTDSSYVKDVKHRFVDKQPKRLQVCSQIFKTMQINSDGSVIPCSIDWERLNVIGNVTNHSLIDIWNGSEMKLIRTKHLEGKRFGFDPCAKCSFNELSDIDDIDEFSTAILARINIT